MMSATKRNEAEMRSLVPDGRYFRFLDELRDAGVATTLAPVFLMQEFPTLRGEEAKAVCADWRARCRERRATLRLGNR